MAAARKDREYLRFKTREKRFETQTHRDHGEVAAERGLMTADFVRVLCDSKRIRVVCLSRFGASHGFWSLKPRLAPKRLTLKSSGHTALGPSRFQRQSDRAESPINGTLERFGGDALDQL